MFLGLDCTAPSRHHEVDHTDHTNHTDHTDQKYIFPERSRSSALSDVFDVVVVVVVAAVAVVFTLNRSFYTPTSAVPPVSFLILHPREIQIMWSQTVRQTNRKCEPFLSRLGQVVNSPGRCVRWSVIVFASTAVL